MEPFYPEFSARFARLLPQLTGRVVAVVGHARPDGDCIGAQVAVARVLTALGVDAVCANPDPVPRRLQFLVGGTAFYRADTLEAGDYAAWFVDCADHARGGEKLRLRFPAPFANIDHHLSNQGFAEHNFIDVGSAATCEILAGMFLDNQLPVDAVAAQALYTGILTDTGQFRFSSTSRRTFLLASELMARGAQPAEAGFELYERESPGKISLLQHFLASFRWECHRRVCIGLLPQGIFEDTGSLPEDTEGLVDYARSIEGVDIGVLIEERPQGIKASLRAHNPAFRLDQVAAEFRGGGHACAAGLNYPGITLNEFYPRLVAALAARIEKVDTERTF